MTGKAQVMRLWRLKPAVVLVVTAMASVLSTPVRANDEIFASIGTGELNGIYYPVGKAICQIVNQDLRTHGIRCSPETTPGSVYNINALRSGELEFAIVQSDVQFAAYSGAGDWIGSPFRGLRSVVSLYPELVTVMARTDSQIRDLSGLAGRRVNVGGQGSGTRATWDAIEAALGWRDGVEIETVPLQIQNRDGWLYERILQGGMPMQLVRKVDGPRFDRFWVDLLCGQS